MKRETTHYGVTNYSDTPIVSAVTVVVTEKQFRTANRRYHSALGHVCQAPIAELCESPAEAVTRWRNELLAEAEKYESKAADLRTRAAIEPVIEAEVAR